MANVFLHLGLWPLINFNIINDSFVALWLDSAISRTLSNVSTLDGQVDRTSHGKCVSSSGTSTIERFVIPAAPSATVWSSHWISVSRVLHFQRGWKRDISQFPRWNFRDPVYSLSGIRKASSIKPLLGGMIKFSQFWIGVYDFLCCSIIIIFSSVFCFSIIESLFSIAESRF